MRRFVPLSLLLFLVVAGCGKDNKCEVHMGETNFTIEPDSARYPGLNNVGGYMYFTGGYRGVVVVRIAYDQFVAFERTCPEDNVSVVEVSEEWGSQLLVCPECGSRFIVAADGIPADGSATPCSLAQYSTSYSGGSLMVY